MIIWWRKGIYRARKHLTFFYLFWIYTEIFSQYSKRKIARRYATNNLINLHNIGQHNFGDWGMIFELRREEILFSYVILECQTLCKFGCPLM